MSWSQSVYSTMVSEIGYDTETQELIVTWAKGGKVTVYKGVPEELAKELANAPSVGQMINNQIKGSYPYRTVR